MSPSDDDPFADAEAASFGERVEGEEKGGGEKPGKPRAGEGRDEAEGRRARPEGGGRRAPEEEEGKEGVKGGGREGAEVEGNERRGDPRLAASASLKVLAACTVAHSSALLGEQIVFLLLLPLRPPPLPRINHIGPQLQL